MKNLKLLRLLIGALISCTPLYSSAQTTVLPTLASTLFDEGTHRFESQAFGAACTPLQEYLRLTANDAHRPLTAQRRHEAAYMLACVAYELQQPDATDRLKNFLQQYPTTSHAIRIEALMGDLCSRRADYTEALLHFNRSDLSQLATTERNYMTYRLALSLLHTGQLSEAAIRFTTLRTVSPRHHTDCTYYLGYIRYAQQRYDEALAAFDEVRHTGSYATLAPYYMAEIYLIRRQYATAASLAAGYIRLYPEAEHTAQMHRIIGSVAYHQANYSQARSELSSYVHTATPDAPKRRDALYMLGLSQYQCGAYTEVPLTLGKVVTQNHTQTHKYDALTQNAYLHMGLAYLQLGKKAAARMAFEQASAIDADPAVKERAAYNYALCIHETAFSAFGENVHVFERFLNNYPASPYANRVSQYLIDVYMTTRSYDAALQSIERVSRPTAALLEAKQKILFQLGTQSFANTLFPQAIDYFSRSLSTGASNPSTRAEATYWMAEANYRIGRMKVSCELFERLLSLPTGVTPAMRTLALYNLGYIAYNGRDYTTAEQHFSKVADLMQSSTEEVCADALNRLGDCRMQARRFDEAAVSYSRSQSMGTPSADYSLYQLALIAGIRKDYPRKIQLLNELSVRYPHSPYVASALYEQGRAYVLSGNAEQAIGIYQSLTSQFPTHPISRKAATETALLYYQRNDTPRAIAAYRDVITHYPGSDEARLALRDLKSIYVDENRVQEFADLVRQMPGSIRFDLGEQDSLTYAAAERVYQKGDLTAAQVSLNRYLQTYPEGAYCLNAHYYLALMAKEQHDPNTLLTHTRRLLEYTGNPYTEEALLMQGEVLYTAKHYADAMKCYERLEATASTIDRRQLGMVGMMRCATAEGSREATVADVVGRLLAQAKLTPELRAEALYHRGKAYLRLQQTDKAKTDLAVPATDTRTLYGAEAKYLLAQTLFLEGNHAGAEQELLDFIDRSTPHSYWLARGFILLSDVYAAMGRQLDARQYLLSLQQNYDADPIIAHDIASRLEKLDKQLK